MAHAAVCRQRIGQRIRAAVSKGLRAERDRGGAGEYLRRRGGDSAALGNESSGTGDPQVKNKDRYFFTRRETRSWAVYSFAALIAEPKPNSARVFDIA